MAIKSVIVSTNRIYSNIPIRLNNVTEFRLKPLWECPSEHFEQRSYAPQQVGVPAYSFGFLGLFQYGDLHSGQMMGVSSVLETHIWPQRSQVHRHTEILCFAIDTVMQQHYKKLTFGLYPWVTFIYCFCITILVNQMEQKISKAKLERIRKMRAFAIIAKGDMPRKVEGKKEVFIVPSQSNPQKTYTVSHNGAWKCTCPDHTETGLKCKHIQSVQMWEKLEQQTNDDILTLNAEIDHPQCDHCQSYNVVKNGQRKNKDGVKQRYLCRDCGRRFVPEQTKYKKASIKLVALCMDLYFKGLSLRKISDTIEQFYGLEVSHVAIRDWINEFMNKINQYVSRYNPDVGDIWNIDEQKVKSEGDWVYSWNIMDKKTRYLIANTITQERSILETGKVFNRAIGNAETKPRMIVTDKMNAYPHVVREYYPEAVHVQVGIRDAINNNTLERYHGTWRERDKVMRGLDSDATAEQMLENYRTYYNFIRRHTALGGKTPAEMAYIDLNLGQNKWLSLIQQATEGKQ